LTVDLVLNNAKAYVKNEVLDCSIAIEQGKIFKIGKETTMPKAATAIDLGRLLVLPGLIDAHVHLRDEGKAYKEDFYSGTAAAAAGGFTTVLDMPNNNPVTMSKETLKNRMEKAEKTVLVNVGFYSEFPHRILQIKDIVKQGAVAFKLFMVEQIGGLNVDDDEALLEAFETVSRLKVPVAVHAEDRQELEKAVNELKDTGHNDVKAFLKAHSERVELKAVRRSINIAQEANVHLHFCHITTESGLKAITDAKKSGYSTTCETTPHNLFLSAEDLERIGNLAITMPPVREKRHIQALWKGIKAGWIDIIGSDHAPYAPEEKNAKTVWDVKVGIPGLETTLPLLLTEVNRGRFSIADVVRLISEKPAGIFKLKGRGHLKEGNKADLTVIDLDRKHKIDASKFHSKAKYSPFDGRQVEGKPVKTFVNGQLIMDEGEIIAKAGSGEIIRRE
jgi:dihydroorotase (multifunctional complex type)